MQDLAALRDDLPLLLRVAVVEEGVDLGQRVERDRVRVDAGRLGLAGHVGADLALQLGDRIGAGPRDGLVGVDDDPLQPDRVAQRHQDRHELHRGAVRVGDDPLVRLEVVGVHLAHDERDPGLHAPRGRVVDHGGATRGRLRSEVARDVGAGAEQGDVDAVERIPGRLANLDGLPADLDRSPGRPARRQESQLPDREASFAEYLDHRPTDDAGGADNGNDEGRRLGHPGMAPQGGKFRRAQPGV